MSRLAIYYHRYSPTTDRTYNIGLVSSVTEPSIAIIAACTPALRRLFTFFAPRYFSEDDTYTYTNTNNATYGNTRSRRSNSVPNDIDKELGINWTNVNDHDPEATYGMENMQAKESREVLNLQRTQSGRTGVSESASQPLTSPTEPFDVLDRRRWDVPIDAAHCRT